MTLHHKCGTKKAVATKVKKEYYSWILYQNNLYELVQITKLIGFHPMVCEDNARYMPVLKSISDCVGGTSTSIEESGRLDRVLRTIVGPTLLDEKRGPIHNIIKGLNTNTDCKHESLLKAFLVMAMVRWLKMNDSRIISYCTWKHLGWMIDVPTRCKIGGVEHPLLISCFKNEDTKGSSTKALRPLSFYGQLAVVDQKLKDPISLTFMALLSFHYDAGSTNVDTIEQHIRGWKDSVSSTTTTLVNVKEDKTPTPTKNKKTRKSPKKATKSATKKKSETTEVVLEAISLPTARVDDMQMDATNERLSDKEKKIKNLCKEIDWDIKDVTPGEEFPNNTFQDKGGDLSKILQLYHEIKTFYQYQFNTCQKQILFDDVDQISDDRMFILDDKRTKYEENAATRLNPRNCTIESILKQEKDTIAQVIGQNFDNVLQFEKDIKGGVLELSKQVDWNKDNVTPGKEYSPEETKSKAIGVKHLVGVYTKIFDWYDKQKNTRLKQLVLNRVRWFTDEQMEIFEDKKDCIKECISKAGDASLNPDNLTELDITEKMKTSMTKFIGDTHLPHIETRYWNSRTVSMNKKHKLDDPLGDESDTCSYGSEEGDYLRALKRVKKGYQALSAENTTEFKTLTTAIWRDPNKVDQNDQVLLSGYFRKFASNTNKMLHLLEKLKFNINSGQEALPDYNNIEGVIRSQRSLLQGFHQTFGLDSELQKHVRQGHQVLYQHKISSENQNTVDLQKPTLPNNDLIKQMENLGLKHVVSFDIFDFYGALGLHVGVGQYIERSHFLGRILCFFDESLEDKGKEVVVQQIEVHKQKGWKHGYLLEKSLSFYCWESLYQKIQDVLNENAEELMSECEQDKDDSQQEKTNAQQIANNNKGGADSQQNVDNGEEQTTNNVSDDQKGGEKRRQTRSSDNKKVKQSKSNENDFSSSESD